MPADRSALERVRQPAITIVNLYDFEDDAALVGDDLARPGAWDALRTRTQGPFALPATPESLRAAAHADVQLCARATAITHWLDAEGIGSVASYGVGAAGLELLLREARPERDLILTEVAPGNVARLRELLPGADVRHHDLLTDGPLDCELHLMHQVDTELRNAGWSTALSRFSSQRILWVAGGLVGPRQLALQLLDLRRRRGRARAGLMRTRGAFESLWAATHSAQPIDVGDLPAWVLEPRRSRGSRLMRVAVLDAYYPAFVASHYAERPGLADASYATQMEAIMARRMGTSDAYSLGLRERGHEAVDILANVWPVQEAWARENGLRIPPLRHIGGRAGAAARRMAGQRIVVEQLRRLAPDVIYVHDMFSLSRRALDGQRAAGRVIAGQIASAAPPDKIVRGYDIVFTSFPLFVDRFRALGVDGVYLPLAFDPRVLDELGEMPERTHDIVFVGGVDARLHPAGTRLLESVAQELPLEIWGYGASSLPAGSVLRERHRGEAWGLDMYRVLASAKICINRHIDVAEGFANNMRMFEATGVGALLCTEAAPNLGELFEPDREIVAYSSVGELTERIRALLADQAALATIAEAGQARTLAEHGYSQRLEQVAGALSAHLAQRRRAAG